MEGAVFGIVVLGLGVSLVIGGTFWRQAPGVTLAIVGGVMGAIAGFVGWVFIPTNLHHVDMLDRGIAWSFGGGLPAAARGFAIGVVMLGALSFALARPPPRHVARYAGPRSGCSSWVW